MHVTREDLNPCTVKLTVVCDPDEVKQGYDTAFKQLTRNLRLPGFRPGKAPRSLLESLISPGEWNEAAGEEIVKKVYDKAIEAEHLEVDRTTPPHIVVETLDREAGSAEFVAKVPLPPRVELGDYKGLPVEQPSADVTDEELDFEIEELRKRGQTRESVTDRGVQEGDVAVLNLKLDGDSGDGRNFMTIAGKTFPGLDEAITGMRVEEMKTAELTFPENFSDKDLAGKSHQVKITLNSLSAVHLPDLNDEFAQTFKTESMDDLRGRLREAIGRAKQSMVRQIVYEKLLDELMARSKVSVSDNMWENLASRRLREYEAEQEARNRTLEDYAKENGMNVEELTEAWRSKAKLEVERALLIQDVYRREAMKVENLDLQHELVVMAREFEMTPEKLLDELNKNNAIDELHFRALSRKVGDFLLANADVTLVGVPG
jgi:trigger factor